MKKKKKKENMLFQVQKSLLMTPLKKKFRKVSKNFSPFKKKPKGYIVVDVH